MPDATADSYKLPDLPKVVYAKFELDQLGEWDNNSNTHIVNDEYAEKIQLAVRIKIQKSDRNEILKKLEKYGIKRSPGTAGYIDDLDSYYFPKIKIKVTDDQGIKKLPQEEFTVAPATFIGGVINLPTHLVLHMCSLTRYHADTDLTNIKFLSANSYAHMSGEGVGWGGVGLCILYSHIQRNINDYKNCRDLNTYNMVKNSLHIGKPLPDNLNDENYTNAYINFLRLEVINPEHSANGLYRKIVYSFSSSQKESYGPYGRVLTPQFITENSQQEIKEEHFPEDM